MEQGGFDRSLRAWEPEPGEVTARNQGKAWRAFKIYRDLGPERTLKRAAAAYYDVPYDTLKEGQYNTVKKWARDFDWHNRVQAFDDHYTMLERQAVERFQESNLQDFVDRQMRIREGMLDVSEKALENARKMVEWPLTEQRMIRDDDTGETTVVIMPAGWSKATARSYFDMAGAAVIGAWTTARSDLEAEDSYDLESLSEEDLAAYLEITSKLGMRPRQ